MKKLIYEEKLHWRLSIYVLGIFFVALGGALSINSALGVSPLNALPYVLSRITGFYIGMCFFALLAVFMLLQIIILRKDFKWIQTTQLLGAFLFGYLLDFARLILGDFSLPTYFGQLALLLIGIAFIAKGVMLFTSVRLVPLPLEGLVAAILKKLPNEKFHRVMITISIVCVILSIVLSLVFLGGLYGVHEGTVLAAVLTGKMMPAAKRAAKPLLDKAGIVPTE